MKKKTNIAIIGAGISGCASAQELQANGIDHLLLEKNVEPGGLTRSISVGDAHFDYTGHYLHLSKCKTPAELPYSKQNNKDWQLIKRKSGVYVKGKIMPAPFQYNLSALPENMRRRCIEDFRNRPYVKNPESFKAYLLSGFGRGMCEIFFFPYNEKQMTTSLDNLSVEAVNRFFPYPDEKEIERGYSKSVEVSSGGYNKYFWYPKHSGIGLLAKGLSADLINLNTCCIVENIDIKNKFLRTSQGEVLYNRLITSMPLKKFCAITNNSKLQLLARSLSHNRVLCLNLFLNGSFQEDFKGYHWIYVPDNNIPFYRVGIYSNLDSARVPSDHTALYVEVAYNNDISPPDLTSVLKEVFFSLEKLHWVRRKDCLVISASWIDCAYVHFNKIRKEALTQILNILHNSDVHPIGRYGLWDYISMEDSIFSGIEVARKLIQD